MHGTGLSEQYRLLLILECFEKDLQQMQLLEGRSCLVIRQEREKNHQLFQRREESREIFQGSVLRPLLFKTFISKPGMVG